MPGSRLQGTSGLQLCSIHCTPWINVLLYSGHIAPHLGPVLDDALSHKNRIVKHCQNYTKRILTLLKTGIGVQWAIWTFWSLISLVEGKISLKFLCILTQNLCLHLHLHLLQNRSVLLLVGWVFCLSVFLGKVPNCYNLVHVGSCCRVIFSSTGGIPFGRNRGCTLGALAVSQPLTGIESMAPG